MVLTLYGTPRSTCTQRVQTVLLEKQIPYELVEIKFMQGEYKSPAYLEKQPFGQIPYIDDDGFILYESRAIARYLEDKYPDSGTRLIPKDAKAKALFEQAASIEYSSFNPHASTVVVEGLFAGWVSSSFNSPFVSIAHCHLYDTLDSMMGKPADEHVLKKNIAALEGKLDVYEKILSKQAYLAGDEVTLADLFHVPYAVLLAPAKVDVLSTRPNVARWLKSLTDRPSWVTIQAGIKSAA